MIGSLLVAVDASDNAKVAVSYAAYLSKELGAALSAVFVIDTRMVNMPYWTDYGALSLPVTNFSTQMQEVLSDQGKRVLARVEEDVREAGVNLRSEVRTGVPATEILEAARESDLIILGRHGETHQTEEGSSSSRDSGGLGAVAERVLRTAADPVLIAPGSFEEPKRVLLCYDGSSRASETMNYAAELAKRLSLPLAALSAHDDEAVARERFERVTRYMDAQGLNVTTLSRPGDPVEAILGEAQPGDLLAMGAFGEGRIRAWLLGSTTEAVLRSTKQPVLLHR